MTPKQPYAGMLWCTCMRICIHVQTCECHAQVAQARLISRLAVPDALHCTEGMLDVPVMDAPGVPDVVVNPLPATGLPHQWHITTHQQYAPRQPDVTGRCEVCGAMLWGVAWMIVAQMHASTSPCCQHSDQCKVWAAINGLSRGPTW